MVGQFPGQILRTLPGETPIVSPRHTEPLKYAPAVHGLAAMSSTQDAVHEQIDRDIFLREALARDFASPKALAQWLQRYRDVEGSIVAIVKAIERYDLDTREEIPFESAWEPLNHATVDQLGPACVAVVDKTPEVQEDLPEVHERINSDHQEILLVIPSSEEITIVFEPEHKDDLREIFPPNSITRFVQNLHLFSVKPTGGPGPRPQAPPTSALVTSLLSAGVEVQYVINSYNDVLILVESEDYPATFRHLNDLAHQELEPSEPE